MRTFHSNILVVGDVMVDKYWFGDSNRISPEAPVPVVKIITKEDRIGGAGNVALNVANLHGKVTLLSIVGNDENSLLLEQKLIEKNVNPVLVRSPKIPTVVKLRVVARNQQMIRCDFEMPPDDKDEKVLFEKFMELLPKYDIVIFSDYGKGALNSIKKMIFEANKLNIPSLVDPKGEDFSKYTGAFAITPNKTELREIVGSWNNECDLNVKAEALRHSLNLKYLILTRSEEGMTLYGNERQFSIKAQAKEVFDVSGAGDSAIAVLGLMLGNGYSIDEALKYSNKAGGIVVGKFGTAPIEYSELFEEEEK